MLSHEQAKRFYDRMAAIQDAQYLFERPALADLVANLEVAGAERWIELAAEPGVSLRNFSFGIYPQVPARTAARILVKNLVDPFMSGYFTPVQSLNAALMARVCDWG